TQIQDDQSFSDLGVDSIITINLINRISKTIAVDLKTTLLFDYNNVNQLTQHIVQEHRATLAAALEDANRDFQQVSVSTTEKSNGNSYQAINQAGLRNRFKAQSNKRSTTKEPIAIIGMSGRFAQSGSVQELWQHLAKGRDLVTEVNRWNL